MLFQLDQSLCQQNKNEMIKQRQRIIFPKRKMFRNMKVMQISPVRKSLLTLKRFHFHILSYIKNQYKKRKTEESKVFGREEM